MRHLHRREVVAGALALAAAPYAARAQAPGRIYHLAVWSSAYPMSVLAGDGGDPWWRAVFLELKRLGFVEGANLKVERYANNSDVSTYNSTARAVVASQPDAIFASPAIPPAQILRGLTTSIPIVVPTVGDPVVFGLAQSLARPGGNVTGFTQDAGLEIHGLRLQLLKEAVPSAKRLAWLTTRTGAIAPRIEFMQQAAVTLGVELSTVAMDGPFDEAGYHAVFSEFAKGGVQAVYVSSNGEHLANRNLIVQLLSQAKLPAIYGQTEYAEVGGLMAHGVDRVDNYRKAAGYVARILNGAKPQDLPFQQPTTFNFIINRKTAKALGISIPESIMIRATEVIE